MTIVFHYDFFGCIGPMRIYHWIFQCLGIIFVFIASLLGKALEINLQHLPAGACR